MDAVDNVEPTCDEGLKQQTASDEDDNDVNSDNDEKACSSCCMSDECVVPFSGCSCYTDNKPLQVNLLVL